MLLSRCGSAQTARPVLACILFLCLLPTLSSAAYAGSDEEPWLLVDTEALTLTVMRGEQPRLTLHNIAVGRYGTSLDKQRGDNTTPLGRFHVAWIQRDSGFHRFIGLDYPDVERAEKAYREGVISQRERQAIIVAHRRGKRPPQDTALGGQIGIHGLGQADPQLHESMNWTRGCVAVTDRQVDALLPWVRVGMTVEIR
jgi:murein L,D-transpeptidase YafK